jgi:hypothetical protein
MPERTFEGYGRRSPAGSSAAVELDSAWCAAWSRVTKASAGTIHAVPEVNAWARFAKEFALTQPYSPQPGYGPLQQHQPHRNGFGITALVAGLVGICISLIPLFGLGAIIAGIIAVIFGLLGFDRARRGIATNTKMAITGTIAGLVAGALGICGLVIVDNAFSDLGNSLKGAAPSVAAPAAPAAPASGNDSGGQDQSTTGAFGQTITWPDGVAVSVSKPETYKPSSSASIGPGAARFVSMKVTVTNGSNKDLAATGADLSATANGAPAEQVFDSAKGLNGSPSSTILPGKSVTFTVAFGLPSKDPGDLQVELRPGFGIGYQPAIFTGQV